MLLGRVHHAGIIQPARAGVNPKLRGNLPNCRQQIPLISRIFYIRRLLEIVQNNQ